MAVFFKDTELREVSKELDKFKIIQHVKDMPKQGGGRYVLGYIKDLLGCEYDLYLKVQLINVFHGGVLCIATIADYL